MEAAETSPMEKTDGAAIKWCWVLSCCPAIVHSDSHVHDLGITIYVNEGKCIHGAIMLLKSMGNLHESIIVCMPTRYHSICLFVCWGKCMENMVAYIK